MKKLVLLWVFLAWFSGVQAQQTSLDLDFSDPAHADRFNFIFDTGGELTKTVADGEMKLEINKKEWHFFQIWVEPFDFIHNPFLSFRIKVDKDTPIRIWVKDVNEKEKTLFDQVIPASEDYQTVQLSFEDVSPLEADLKELGLDIGGYQVPPATFSATVLMDYFRLGEAAKPITEVYGTSYSEDFSGDLYAGWAGGEGYNLSKDGDALKMDIDRINPVTEAQINKLPSLNFGAKVLDVSANPYINLDIKGNDPFVLSVIASDAQKIRNEYKIRVLPTGKFQTISLDLSSLPGIDLSQIEKFYFDFNRDGFFFKSTVWIDNISIGGSAANLAVMDAVDDKKYYKNSGTKQIQLTHIQHASGIELGTIPSFIENASVSEIENGTAILSFTVKPDKTGSENLSFTLKGASGYGDQQYSFTITIEGNLPPAIDAIADVQAEAKKSMSINLTGISDGNSTAQQPLTFEVTSSDPKVITGSVEYKGEGPFGTLMLDPKKKGTATVTVTVKDNGDGDNSTSISFEASVYNNLNQAPTIDQVANIEVYQDAGPSSLTLTGISDGDKSNQKLTISASSSNPGIVKNVVVNYTSGSEATLNYMPVADTTGTSTITVKIVDNGGTGSNDGNDSTSISFNITVLQKPITGYVATLDRSVEGFGANEKFKITEVDSAGFKALVFEATDKFFWDGVFMNLPQELDLSENPYLTMEVYPIEQNTLHWIWFYDVNGQRNTMNNRSGEHLQKAVAGKWNKLVFDFSGENDWIDNGTNQPINNKRITGILFDMHNTDFSWPPPANYTGTFIVRNIRIGSEADFVPPSNSTINPVANQVAFTNATDQKVRLSGITNGKGGQTGVEINVENSNPSVVLNPAISAVDSSGQAILTYNTGATKGKSTITLTVSSGGSADSTVSFTIDVLPNEASAAAVVTVDMSKKFQKMYGFGTFTNGRQYSEMYTDLMGGSAMRIGLIENQIEPVNDNDDPNVINMEALNYGAFDWDYYRDLKARGVETFILTSWGPPAWMKTNLSIDYKAPGFSLNTDETTNRLDYAMYDEFAESMVMVVKAFQQRSGITLEAIGLQNEPAFHEPYASAILDVQHFKELIKVVGARFKKEGIPTRLYFAEHLVDEGDFFLPQNLDYINAVKNDPVADQYGDIFAVHGYGNDGITPGQPTYKGWQTLWAAASTGENPKDLWMTETFREYNSWEDAFGIAGAVYGALEHGNVSLWTQWAFEGQMAKQGKPTPMLYAMSNFAKFIRPGHVRVASKETNNDVLATSFLDEATGQLSVVMLNKGEEAVSVNLEGQGLPTSWKMYITSQNRDLEEVNVSSNDGIFLLPPKSVATFVGTTPIQMATVSFRLINADTDKEIGVIEEGSVIDLATLPSPRINILAVTSPAEVGSVAFQLNTKSKLENHVPYAFAGDNMNGDFYGFWFKKGPHKLSATPYSHKWGRGSAGKTSIVNFMVVNGAKARAGAEEGVNVVAYPNPLKERLTVELGEEVVGNVQLSLVDGQGRIMLQTETWASGEGSLDLDLSKASLKPGMYLLRVVDSNGKSYVCKLLK